jgi:hypothetical protein
VHSTTAADAPAIHADVPVRATLLKMHAVDRARRQLTVMGRSADGAVSCYRRAVMGRSADGAVPRHRRIMMGRSADGAMPRHRCIMMRGRTDSAVRRVLGGSRSFERLLHCDDARPTVIHRR